MAYRKHFLPLLQAFRFLGPFKSLWILVGLQKYVWGIAGPNFLFIKLLSLDNTSEVVTKTGFTVCGLLSKPSAAFFATQLR